MAGASGPSRLGRSTHSEPTAAGALSNSVKKTCQKKSEKKVGQRKVKPADPTSLEMQEMMKQYGDMMPKVDRVKAKDEMGSWIADYFDDAGYQDWEKASVMYKSMLMSAFPPIDPLDEKKPNYTTMSIEEIEEARSQWMRGIHALQQHAAGPPSPLS